LSLVTLFAPTLSHYLSLLRDQFGTADHAASGEAPEAQAPPPVEALVTLQAGSPEHLPFFCVHGAGGSVLNFRDLARAMGESQPFYGLQARGLDGMTPPHDTVEAMATAYLEEVRARQPEGPYALGGYSGGGVVALEMARMLTNAGQGVRVLALLDTFHPQMPIRAVTMRTRLARLRDEGFAYIGEVLNKGRRARARLSERLHVRILEECQARGEPVPLALRELQLVRNFLRVVPRYRPGEWPGRAILLRAEKVAFIFQDRGPCNGWERHVTGGVDVVTVPGDHFNLLLGANAEAIARVLRQAIAPSRPVAPLSTVAAATI
jgi:thioesterase domain-containing protein